MAPDQRLRILRVIGRLNVGGPAQHVANLMRLQERGFDTLLVHGPAGPDEASMTDLLAGGNAIELPDLGREVEGRRDMQALRALVRICREFRPHIVHTHTAKAGSLGRTAVQLARLPWGARSRTVHTFHGHVFDGYFGRLGSFAVRQTERALARVTDRIIAISPEQEHDLVSRFAIAPARKVRVVRLGLDLEQFSGVTTTQIGPTLGWEDGRPLIGIVGRLVPIKNHELFFAAAARLKAMGARAGYVVVGGGERLMELQALVDAGGLRDDVRFLGWRRDLAALYGGMSIVTLTSRNEGTPVAVIEAMAAGRPVVATAVGGVADVITHGQTGWLVPPGDSEALARAWRDVLDQPAAAGRVGAAARQAALARYGYTRLLDDMESIYRNLV